MSAHRMPCEQTDDTVFTFESLLDKGKEFGVKPSYVMFVYFYCNGMPKYEALLEGLESVGDASEDWKVKSANTFEIKRFAASVLRSPKVQAFKKWWKKYGGKHGFIDPTMYRWSLRDSEEEMRLAVAQAAAMLENFPASASRNLPIYVEAIRELTNIVKLRDELERNDGDAAQQQVVFKGGDALRA